MKPWLPTDTYRTAFFLLTAAVLAATQASGCTVPEDLDGEPSLAPGGGKADRWSSHDIAPLVRPLLKTSWGQDGAYKSRTPLKDGEHTYPGCTTIASAQVLYYYQYRNRPQSEVFKTEIFGPVLGLMHVDTIDDAIALVNGGQYGNMACLFTSSGSAARKFRYEVEAGNIGINIGNRRQPVEVDRKNSHQNVADKKFGG